MDVPDYEYPWTLDRRIVLRRYSVASSVELKLPSATLSCAGVSLVIDSVIRK